MSISFFKDPAAVLDYDWDWTSWLTAASDTIASHTVTAPAGLTVEADEENDGIVTGWLSGGSLDESYDVVCQIVTTGGRTDERTITIVIRNQ